MVVLAEHFFRKLSLSDTYTIDNDSANYKNIYVCKCGSCKLGRLSSCFDDTSIGELSAWNIEKLRNIQCTWTILTWNEWMKFNSIFNNENLT